MKGIFLLLLVSFTVPSFAQDITVLFTTKPYRAPWGCPGYFEAESKIKYDVGLECVNRSSQGTCEVLRPFWRLSTISDSDPRTFVMLGHKTISGPEGLDFAKAFSRSIGRMGRDNSPFVSEFFMVTEGIGFAALVLFPITVPIDLITMPLQVAAFEAELVYRKHKYKQIPKIMTGFITSGITSSGVTLGLSDGQMNVARNLPATGLDWCPR